MSIAIIDYGSGNLRSAEKEGFRENGPRRRWAQRYCDEPAG